MDNDQGIRYFLTEAQEVTGLEIREAKGGAGGGGGGGRGGGGRGGGARTGGRGSAGFLPGGRARSGPKADPDADDKTDKCNSFFDFIGFCD